MSAGLGGVVRSGVGRRRVQTVVMALTTLLAVTASVLAVGLLVASSEPFARAFDRQHGAHLAAQFDAAKVSTAQLAATAHAARVTAADGPFPTIDLVPIVTRSAKGLPEGIELPPVTIVGRPDAGTDLDRLELTEGRYATGPAEIVWADGIGPFSVGDRVKFAAAPGAPTVTIVGLARSIGNTGQVWALPATVTALTAADAKPGLQMLYRFSPATTDADINAGRDAVAAGLPDGA